MLSLKRVDHINDIKGARQCRHCGLSIRVGQWYFTHHMRNAPITDQHFNIHAQCIKSLAVDIPDDPDTAKAKFDALRASMVATGKAFP